MKSLSSVLTVVAILMYTMVGGSLVSADDNSSIIWEKLRSDNHFAMMRHALAPGFGDPAGFSVGDCETQRNLSEKGLEQAKSIGKLFHENGIQSAQVYSSQWCRCLDTAALLYLGQVKELPVLNSFFGHNEREKAQTEELTQWLERRDLSTPIILVTHQVNITAFTHVYPDSGEIIVVQRLGKNQYIAVGTIKTN